MPFTLQGRGYDGAESNFIWPSSTAFFRKAISYHLHRQMPDRQPLPESALEVFRMAKFGLFSGGLEVGLAGLRFQKRRIFPAAFSANAPPKNAQHVKAKDIPAKS
jgi:hypothetical protein